MPYAVAFAKLTLRDDGTVVMIDAFFGRWEPEDSKAAEAQGRACVSGYTRYARHTVLPRVVPLAADRFEQIDQQMNEVSHVMAASTRCSHPTGENP